MKKVMLSFDEKFLSQVDEMAKELGLNRSAFITSALGEYIYQKNTTKNVATLFAQQVIESDDFKNLLKEKFKPNE